jgi:hypothetical protein
VVVVTTDIVRAVLAFHVEFAEQLTSQEYVPGVRGSDTISVIV